MCATCSNRLGVRNQAKDWVCTNRSIARPPRPAGSRGCAARHLWPSDAICLHILNSCAVLCCCTIPCCCCRLRSSLSGGLGSRLGRHHLVTALGPGLDGCLCRQAAGGPAGRGTGARGGRLGCHRSTWCQCCFNKPCAKSRGPGQSERSPQRQYSAEAVFLLPPPEVGGLEHALPQQHAARRHLRSVHGQPTGLSTALYHEPNLTFPALTLQPCLESTRPPWCARAPRRPPPEPPPHTAGWRRTAAPAPARGRPGGRGGPEGCR